MATTILSNRDECFAPLRRDAVMLIGSQRDDAAANALIPVAKSDPSPGVRATAVNALVSMPGQGALSAVIELAHSATDEQTQRIAINALSRSSNPRARAEVRTYNESPGATAPMRAMAIDGFGSDHLSADDATWLRNFYPRAGDERIKARIIETLGRNGSDANNEWIAALVRNEDEPIELRATALDRAGRTMDIATLVKLYDASPARPIRATIVQLLATRKEPEALDKVVEIARSGTDPDMRRQAISVLARSKDPRASKLLLQLVDK
jgi:HEAT repeat protein